jgi:hypothetical protein
LFISIISIALGQDQFGPEKDVKELFELAAFYLPEKIAIAAPSFAGQEIVVCF